MFVPVTTTRSDSASSGKGDSSAGSVLTCAMISGLPAAVPFAIRRYRAGHFRRASSLLSRRASDLVCRTTQRGQRKESTRQECGEADADISGKHLAQQSTADATRDNPFLTIL